MEYGIVLLALAVIFGLFMAWGIGANDVANAMGTSVGSRALTIRQAVVVAGVFVFAGAWLAGGEVTQTIRSGMVDSELLADSPDLLVFGMLAALAAAGTWLMVASYFGWPVSTTHSIIGAIIGFAVVGLGFEVVRWERVGTIAASWVLSPMIGGAIAFALFRSVQLLILDTVDPLKNAKRWAPLYIFLTAMVTSLVTILRGLRHVGLELTAFQSYSLALVVSLGITVAGTLAVHRLQFNGSEYDEQTSHFGNVEKVFGVLMIITGSAMAFALGSNDVANAVGPLAAVVDVIQTGEVDPETLVPMWVLLLGGFGIVFGLFTYGHKVIATVGSGITQLTPSRGYAATAAAAATVTLASGTGLPISTTHTLVGAILGVGLARGIAAIDLRLVRMIFMSWIVTLPAGAILAILFFFVLRGLLG